MPKAILELEMPESCWQCHCVEDIASFGLEYKCRIDNTYCPKQGRRADCSLKLVESTEPVSQNIYRRIDNLGRVVIPKDIRNRLKINEGDALDIYIWGDMVCFKKHDEEVE